MKVKFTKENAFFTVLCVVLLGFSQIIYAQAEKQDTVQISLLTCAPGNEVYELFGHTGIRVREIKGEYDVVFNYGLFSFSTPNFIYRFTKGETDYQLGAENFQSFIFQYGMRGSAVHEQILNMTQIEAKELFNALIVNNLPQNKTYRYNFLYDNCTLRARQMINKHMWGSVIYNPPADTVTTFRDMIHHCTRNYPWLTFGIDMALGSPLDVPVSYAEQMFLPSVLMQAYQSAEINRGDTLRVKMVEIDREILPSEDIPAELTSPFLTPVAVSIYLLVFALLLTIWDIKRKKVSTLFDSVYFLICGLTGVVLFFLMFISTHPATYPNYTAVWLQPFHLFLAIAVWVKMVKNIVYYYHFANFALLLLFLMAWHWLPQSFNPAFLPLCAILLIRSAGYLIIKRKRREINE